MFEESSVMVLVSDKDGARVYKLEMEKDVQAAICETFSSAADLLVGEKEKVIFDGSYKPLEDEYLAIRNFQMQAEIKEAVQNPMGVAGYQLDETISDTKAVFVGEMMEKNGKKEVRIAFQMFRNDQYITTKRINLFFENNTFVREKRFGIGISKKIDCFFDNEELMFDSYHFTRQIFDLSDYYRSATDQEVSRFVKNDKLFFEKAETFQSATDTWVRRKIALINDSGVLERYKPEKIKTLAKASGIKIFTQDNQIIIPSDKKQMKVILSFLDEEAYKGPFSNDTYLTNSKRKVTA